MSSIATIATQLIRNYSLQNLKTLNAHQNPYENRIPGAIPADPELYKSSLGTPVFSDITLGDKINPNNNQWKDNDGKLQSFTPMTFYTVLLSVSIPKRIVMTEIQGRPGTIKEYIGMGDYQVTINGVITGANGHYPKDEVRNLNKIISAPIAIVVTSWYLQNLNIHNLVINSGSEISQDEGGYSYQQFSIPAVSDFPVELKIKQ
jgi:hypothetical protein